MHAWNTDPLPNQDKPNNARLNPNSQSFAHINLDLQCIEFTKFGWMDLPRVPLELEETDKGIPYSFLVQHKTQMS